MRTLFLLALALASVGCNTTRFADGRSEASASPSNRLNEIIGASIERGRLQVVVTAEAREPNGRKQFRFVNLRPNGSIIQNVLINKDALLQYGHKTIMYKGRFGLGWVESGRGVLFASVQQEAAKVETIVDEDSDEGAIGDFWLVNTKGQPKLLVSRYRYVDPQGKRLFGKQYTWLYAYALGGDGLKATGKACIENAELQCGELACAASGDGIVVWQSVHRKGSDIDTVRFAKWTDEAQLDWRERYQGNDFIGLWIDPAYGSACLASEWKSPADASGIICGVRVDTTSVVPVGAYGDADNSGGGPICFGRIAKLKLWALAFKRGGSIEVDLLNDDFSPCGTVKVDGGGVTDYALVPGEDDAWLVLLRDGSLSCQEISLTSVRSGFARRTTKPVR